MPEEVEEQEPQEKKKVISPYRQHLEEMKAKEEQIEQSEEQRKQKQVSKANQNRLERIAYAVEVLAMKAMGVALSVDFNKEGVVKNIQRSRDLQLLLNGESFEELALLEEMEEPAEPIRAEEPAAEEGA